VLTENSSSLANQRIARPGELDASAILVESASTVDDRVAIYRFRYAIYIEQMGKSYPFADHKLRQLSDSLDDDASLLFVKHSERVIATVRLNWGHDRQATMAYRDQFSGLPPASLCFCSRLMIDPQYRSYRPGCYIIRIRLQIGPRARCSLQLRALLSTSPTLVSPVRVPTPRRRVSRSLRGAADSVHASA
jgi:hypothetical protein